MAKVVVLIPTYNRPQLLKPLIEDLRRELDCRIKVYDDCSPVAYDIDVDYYHRFKARHNKHYFWKLHQVMYNDLKRDEFDYCIQLLDDTRLVEGFGEKVITQFNECGAGMLNIMLPIALNDLLTREGCPFYMVGENKYWRKHWNDLCFITDRKFFDSIGWTCPSLSQQRWKRNPRASSGVGTLLTRAYKGTIVIVGRSLLHHTGQVSQMNTYRKGYYAYV